MTPTREAGAAVTFSMFIRRAREQLSMEVTMPTGRRDRAQFDVPVRHSLRWGMGGASGRRPRMTGDRPWTCAFTLLELMIVLSLILILASMAVPTYHVAIVRSREAVLRDDLYTLRKLIDEFTLDKRHPPASLDELVDAGYLRGGIPVDPMTGKNDTWRVDLEDVPMAGEQATPGIVDVHSGSEELS